MVVIEVSRSAKDNQYTQAEGSLIGGLVLGLMISADTQDIYSFVAIEDNPIIGSILFMHILVESGINAFLLSPVAILTNHQGKGFGQKLIKFGIECLREEEVKLVFTYGDPNFYSKVGFRTITEKTARAPLELTHPEGWLCQSLPGDKIEPIAGNSRCVEALNKQEYW